VSSAARGDTRPCIQPGCKGVMQFGRRPSATAAGASSTPSDPGWVCNANPAHFTATITHP